MAATVPTYDTMEEVQQYFDTCKAYWIRSGNTPGVATCKAFWWDCVEVWNASNAWNPAKEQFVRAFRGYRRGDPVPEGSFIESGNA